jgi:hypothetical protein
MFQIGITSLIRFNFSGIVVLDELLSRIKIVEMAVSTLSRKGFKFLVKNVLEDGSFGAIMPPNVNEEDMEALDGFSEFTLRKKVRLLADCCKITDKEKTRHEHSHCDIKTTGKQYRATVQDRDGTLYRLDLISPCSVREEDALESDLFQRKKTDLAERISKARDELQKYEASIFVMTDDIRSELEQRQAELAKLQKKQKKHQQQRDELMKTWLKTRQDYVDTIQKYRESNSTFYNDRRQIYATATGKKKQRRLYNENIANKVENDAFIAEYSEKLHNFDVKAALYLSGIYDFNSQYYMIMHQAITKDQAGGGEDSDTESRTRSESESDYDNSESTESNEVTESTKSSSSSTSLILNDSDSESSESSSDEFVDSDSDTFENMKLKLKKLSKRRGDKNNKELFDLATSKSKE